MSVNLNRIKLVESLSEMFKDGIIESIDVDKNINYLSNFKSEFKSGKFLKSENIVLNYFKALSNSQRLKIVHLLKKGVKCSCQLEYTLSLSQPSISHHLKVLQKAKIITLKPKGKYRLIYLNETPMIYWILSQFY